VDAPKIAAGTLRAIFIECSFADSVCDDSLYGHLCPRHLIAELQVLAVKVFDLQKPDLSGMATRKRKRQGSVASEPAEQGSPRSAADDAPRLPSRSRRASSVSTRRK